MKTERYIRNYIQKFNMLDRCFWNYEDGCVLIGLQDMYEATQNKFYFESIKNYMDRYINEYGLIKYYDPKEYNIDKIPSGRVLFLLYEKSKDEKYHKAIELMMGQLRNHPRTECGSFWHKKIYPYQIWLDGLYMGMPFYLTYETIFDQGRCFEDIVHQFQNARKFLYNKDKNLYYHAYDEKKTSFWADHKTGCSKNFWSRAMGWYLMALIDCYDIMPESEQRYRKIIADLLKEAMDGMLKYQEKDSKLFYQLTEMPEMKGNYLETSASAMVSYTILKGCRLSVFDYDLYYTKGEEILLSLESRRLRYQDGHLSLDGMCLGAGLGPENNMRRDGSVKYYLSEPVVSDEQKGTGAFLMAYSEWLKAKRILGLNYTETPSVEIYNNGY